MSSSAHPGSLVARFLFCIVVAAAPAACGVVQADGEFVDTIGMFGETALNRAVLGGELSTVRLLLKAGADANFRPATPWAESHGSPLLDCMSRVRDANKLQLARLLVEHGADLDFVNAQGGNVLSCAIGTLDMWRQVGVRRSTQCSCLWVGRSSRWGGRGGRFGASDGVEGGTGCVITRHLKGGRAAGTGAR
jgi:hypothetical protein